MVGLWELSRAPHEVFDSSPFSCQNQNNFLVRTLRIPDCLGNYHAAGSRAALVACASVSVPRVRARKSLGLLKMQPGSEEANAGLGC